MNWRDFDGGHQIWSATIVAMLCLTVICVLGIKRGYETERAYIAAGYVRPQMQTIATSYWTRPDSARVSK